MADKRKLKAQERTKCMMNKSPVTLYHQNSDELICIFHQILFIK